MQGLSECSWLQARMNGRQWRTPMRPQKEQKTLSPRAPSQTQAVGLDRPVSRVGGHARVEGPRSP